MLSRAVNKTECSLYFNIQDGGAMRDRTADLLRARQALSQLSYSPIKVSILYQSLEKLVGLSGLEPPTSRLSGERSNHLSYRPSIVSFTYKPYQSVWTLIVIIIV